MQPRLIVILLVVILDLAAPNGLCFGAPQQTVTAPAAAERKKSGPDLGVALLRSGNDPRPLNREVLATLLKYPGARVEALRREGVIA